jgi:hypothetical protein
MSGGYFDYKKYQLNDIIDDIERVLNRQGKERPKEERWCSDEYLEKYPEEKYYPTYSKEIQEKLQEAIKSLTIARIYVQRVDWFLSGDDGDESFLRELSEELDKV